MIDDKDLVNLAIFAILLSGCSLVVDGREIPQTDDPWTRTLVDGGLVDVPDSNSIDAAPDAPASIDASVIDASVIDASVIDASPPICDVFTDDGCDAGQVCKYFGAEECVDPMSTMGDGDPCNDDAHCITGLGCYSGGSFCTPYCVTVDDCPAGNYSCASNLCLEI